MDRFQIIQPSALLAPYVKQYWFLTLEEVKQGAQRLLPFGCMSISFHRGTTQTYSSADHGFLPLSFVAGQTSGYTDIIFSGSIDFITIVFHPVGARLFFNIPMDKFYNEKITLDDLNDHQLPELEKRLQETESNEKCVEQIEKFLIRRFTKHRIDKRMLFVSQQIEKGEYGISSLARTACLGYKQFKRIFTEQIGTNPKEFIRVTRTQKALQLLQVQPELSLTQLSQECGYYDKSHFIKELKEITGYTPAEFLSRCDPYSEPLALFRSAFVDEVTNDL